MKYSVYAVGSYAGTYEADSPAGAVATYINDLDTKHDFFAKVAGERVLVNQRGVSGNKVVFPKTDGRSTGNDGVTVECLVDHSIGC